MTESSFLKLRLIILISFLIALILYILPLPSWAEWWRPHWVLLVLIFWGTQIPERVGVGTAFVLGLLLDALNGNILGENALALVLISYFIGKFAATLRILPLWQQTLAVFVLTIIEQIVFLWIQRSLGYDIASWLYWLTPLSSMLFWPWVFILLRNLQQRFTLLQ